MGQAASSNWPANYEDPSLIWGDPEGQEEMFVSTPRLHCYISSSHIHGFVHRPVFCWTLEMMIQMNGLQFKKKCHLLRLFFVCQFCYSKVFRQYKYIFVSWLKQMIWNRLPHFITAFIGKICLASRHVARLDTTCDVTSLDNCPNLSRGAAHAAPELL